MRPMPSIPTSFRIRPPSSADLNSLWLTTQYVATDGGNDQKCVMEWWSTDAIVAQRTVAKTLGL